MQRRRGLVRIVVAVGLVLALSGVAGLAQAACTRTYRGDLVLEGSQRLVITEGVLCVGGKVILRDTARLEISNATLRMTGFEKTLWDDQCYIYAFGQTSVSLTDVSLEIPGATDGSLVFFGYDAARVQLERVRLVGSTAIRMHVSGWSATTVTETSVRRFHMTERARAELKDVRVEHDLMLGYSGSARAEISGLRPGLKTSLEIERETPDAGVRLTVHDTYVHGWVLDIGDQARVGVVNSTLTGVHLSIGEQTAVVEGVRPGHHALWSFEQGSTPGTSGNLKLTNTSVGFWALQAGQRRAPLTLRDSSIEALGMWRCTSRVTLERLHLRNWDVIDSQFSIVADSLTILRGLRAVDSRLTFQGSVRFQYSFERLVWQNSTASREFEVQVRNRDGQPALGVAVRVEDPLGRIITYTSDQEGVARFTIWFSDTTYDKTWHLLVPQGDTTARVPITLLTSTPVQVTAW